MRADLDTLLIAVYCAACSLFPAPRRRRRGRPQTLTDNELLCLMVAQMLLGHPSERAFMPIARRRLGHLFPHLLSQSRYNERCRQLLPKLVVLWRAIAHELPGYADAVAVLDTTPLPCGQSRETANRSELAPWCELNYAPAHSRWFWGMRLVLLCGLDGTIRDFDLVPATAREREVGLALLKRQPQPPRLLITDKGFSGRPFETALNQLGGALIRPSRRDEDQRQQPPTAALRQRIESIIQTLKDGLRLEQHLARTPTGLCARIAARVLALCAAIHLNWQLGLPPRTLSPYAH
jgi:hypothetical protein